MKVVFYLGLYYARLYVITGLVIVLTHDVVGICLAIIGLVS